MITKDFMMATDSIIERIQKASALFVNGNVMVAIPQVAERSAGGIVISEGQKDLEHRLQGFGRILALPINLDPEKGDAPLKVGDFADFVHTSVYKKDPKILKYLLKLNLPENLLYIVSDPEFLCLWPKESVPLFSDELEQKAN
jgi:hypothetical protein